MWPLSRLDTLGWLWVRLGLGLGLVLSTTSLSKLCLKLSLSNLLEIKMPRTKSERVIAVEKLFSDEGEGRRPETNFRIFFDLFFHLKQLNHKNLKKATFCNFLGTLVYFFLVFKDKDKDKSKDKDKDKDMSILS